MLNASYFRATPFSYGAGHVRPKRAMDPGLVYDLGVNDYLNFLCTLGYNQTLITLFSEDPYACPKQPISLANFNYPSITVPELSGSSPITISRTVKNVGTPGIYRVRVREPAGISVVVEPNSLEFDEIGEEKTFSVTLKFQEDSAAPIKEYAFGKLIWSDSNKHYVRSPIVVKAVV